MGETNRIPARAGGAGLETPFGTVPWDGPRGDAVLCLRPDAVGTGPGALAIGPARVRDAAFFGTHTRAHLVPEAAPDLVLVAHLAPTELPEPGAVLTLSAATDPLTAFPTE
nr:TOBE domain-containing protein [Roseivivax isoporae]